MSSVIKAVEAKYQKHDVVAVRSGDTVRVHQKIREGNKERVQVFEGLVIRTDRKNSHTSSITVRRIASGVGVEKSYLLHSPLVEKVEVIKRSKVRRNYLTYMRARTGKSARLASVDFNKEEVNTVKNAPAAESEDEQQTAETAAASEEKSPSAPEAVTAETEPKSDKEAAAAEKAAGEKAKAAPARDNQAGKKG